MKKFILTTMIAAMFVAFSSTTVSAQEKGPKTLKKTEMSEKSRGATTTRQAATVNIADNLTKNNGGIRRMARQKCSQRSFEDGHSSHRTL